MIFNNIINKKIVKNKQVIYNSRSLKIKCYITIRCNGMVYILLAKDLDKWNTIDNYLEWNETITECVIRSIYEKSKINITQHEFNIIDSNLYDGHVVQSQIKGNQDLIVPIYISLDMPFLPVLNNQECQWSKLSDIEKMNTSDINNNNKEEIINYITALIMNNYYPLELYK